MYSPLHKTFILDLIEQIYRFEKAMWRFLKILIIYVVLFLDKKFSIVFHHCTIYWTLKFSTVLGLVTKNGTHSLVRFIGRKYIAWCPLLSSGLVCHTGSVMSLTQIHIVLFLISCFIHTCYPPDIQRLSNSGDSVHFLCYSTLCSFE